MKVEDVIDYIALAVPEDIDPLSLLDGLNERLESLLLAQFAPGPVPIAILLDPVEWHYTSDPAEIERVQPEHDCDECKRGNERAREFLEGHPGRTVVYGNVHYKTVWR
jgi:hypothetical protein